MPSFWYTVTDDKGVAQPGKERKYFPLPSTSHGLGLAMAKIITCSEGCSELFSRITHMRQNVHSVHDKLRVLISRTV